jgi:hypothetical protein
VKKSTKNKTRKNKRKGALFWVFVGRKRKRYIHKTKA